MALFSSSVGSNHEDSDITIIHPSIIHEHNDEYMNNTQTNTENSLNRQENAVGRNDYIFVDHNTQENAKQLEEVLEKYIRDLKQDSINLVTCDQQLVVRLMNIIRLAYSDDQKKNIELDKVIEEIASLHDKRHVEQKEKTEQLRTEICQLQKMLITVNDTSSYTNHHQTYSMFNPEERGLNSIQDQDQWTAIEDDAKILQDIVQSQKNQINEIVTLISETNKEPNTTLNKSQLLPFMTSSINPPKTPEENTSNDLPTPIKVHTLLQKVLDFTGLSQSPEVPPQPSMTLPSLENHSPGPSPTHSLATLTLESVTPTIPKPNPLIEEPPHEPINIPLPVPPIVEPKTCPVCRQEFSPTTSDIDMYDHIDKCLFQPSTQPKPKEYECGNCNRKFPDINEETYHQHLSDCYNRV